MEENTTAPNPEPQENSTTLDTAGTQPEQSTTSAGVEVTPLPAGIPTQPEAPQEDINSEPASKVGATGGPMPEPKPSIGRIVTYRQEGAKFAAIITEVVQNVGEPIKAVSLYVISPSDAYFARNVEQGEGDREWSWPERV